MKTSILMKRLKRHSIVLKIYNKFLSNTEVFLSLLAKELNYCDSVLDLGCGHNSPLSILPISSRYTVGVDLFKFCILESRKNDTHYGYILGDLRDLGIRNKSFDAIIMLNVLEHLEKKDGQKLLTDIEKIAKKKIIISVPHGLQIQESYAGNPYQKHRSAWFIQDFKDQGYLVKGISGLYILKRHGKDRLGNGQYRFKPYILWFIVTNLSQKLTYYFPKLDYQLFCIKNLYGVGGKLCI